MTKLRALDLFCGAGGASSGLATAGFDVTGIDIAEQPRYPFRFIRGDVFELIESGDIDLDAYDFVWASPPCQGHTAYKRRPDHVRPVDTDGAIKKIRALLNKSRAAYAIENVPGAPLLDPITLCGSMFALDVRRHRCFETSFPMIKPSCRHELQQGDFPQATNRKNRRKTAEIGVWRIPLNVQQRAMKIDWMQLEELSEAIPPAYSEWIARQWQIGKFSQ
jgi:DNA (cytosine-5)-methyltransferase 1